MTEREPESDALWTWLAAKVGGSIIDRHRLVSGNSRTTWTADVRTADGVVPVVVRTDAGEGPFSGTQLSLAREAQVYEALHPHPVRIPRPYGFDPQLNALVVECAPGHDAWDEHVLDALLAELARLHAIEADAVELPGFAREARQDLELWAAIAQRRVHPASLVVDLAMEVLRVHFPGEPARLVVVHGDPGPRNLLWHDGALSAMLDWEMTHFGDPHDDLAFLTVRAGLFGLPLPDFARRVRSEYGAGSGLELDPERLRYWQAVGVLRNLVTCLASVSNPVRGRDRLVHYMLLPALDRLLLGMLAELEGVELEPTPEPQRQDDLPGASVIKEISHELDALVPAIEDPERRQRARRMRYLLTQLAETWPLAFDIASADAAEPPARDTAERLRRLTRIADRRLALFPRARELATMRLPGLE
jgi:aminoglycoside phosphotransferase (APT) family kinase protein